MWSRSAVITYVNKYNQSRSATRAATPQKTTNNFLPSVLPKSLGCVWPFTPSFSAAVRLFDLWDKWDILTLLWSVSESVLCAFSLNWSRLHSSSQDAVSDNKPSNSGDVLWDQVDLSFASHWGCTISENEESALEDQWIGIVVTSFWVSPPAPAWLSAAFKLFYLRVVPSIWYCLNACWTRITREWKCNINGV